MPNRKYQCLYVLTITTDLLVIQLLILFMINLGETIVVIAIGVDSNCLRWLYPSLRSGAVFFHEYNAEFLLDPQDIDILSCLSY